MRFPALCSCLCHIGCVLSLFGTATISFSHKGHTTNVQFAMTTLWKNIFKYKYYFFLLFFSQSNLKFRQSLKGNKAFCHNCTQKDWSKNQNTQNKGRGGYTMNRVSHDHLSALVWGCSDIFLPLQGCPLSPHQQKQEMITAHWLHLLPTPCGSKKWYNPASESACCYGNTSNLSSHPSLYPCFTRTAWYKKRNAYNNNGMRC